MIAVRRAGIEDADRLAENRLEFARLIRDIEDPDGFLNHTKAYLREHLKDGSAISYIAAENGEIVSSCILCIYETLPVPSCLSGRSGLLLNVYTLSGYRRRGLAYDLLTRLIADARELGVGKILLTYTADGFPLYKKLGFEACEHELALRLGQRRVMLRADARFGRLEGNMLNREIEDLLLENGAALVGFADIGGLYKDADVASQPQSEDSQTAAFDIPRYPRGVAIAVAIPADVVAGIKDGPTMAYYNQYYALNGKLDGLAALCSAYIRNAGYHAYPQTVAETKEYGVFRTIMPHKTVAVHAGLGWVGKSALFVTEQYGSAIRLTSVLTDAPIDCGDTMMEPKCGGCMICAEACPGKAVSGSLWKPELDRDDYFDVMACRLKARERAAAALGKVATICGKCIEVCPYTQNYIKRMT